MLHVSGASAMRHVQGALARQRPQTDMKAYGLRLHRQLARMWPLFGPALLSLALTVIPALNFRFVGQVRHVTFPSASDSLARSVKAHSRRLPSRRPGPSHSHGGDTSN